MPSKSQNGIDARPYRGGLTPPRQLGEDQGGELRRFDRCRDNNGNGNYHRNYRNCEFLTVFDSTSNVLQSPLPSDGGLGATLRNGIKDFRINGRG